MRIQTRKKNYFSKKVKVLSLGLILIGSVLSLQFQVFAAALPGPMTVSVAKSTFSTGENIVINWTAATNATKYGLTVRKAPYKGDKNVVWDHYVTGTSKKIGKLPAGDYLVRMMPYNSAGAGSVSNTVYFSVKAPTPAIPGAMTVSVKSSFKITENFVINWTASINATKYGLSIWQAPYGGDPIWDHYVTGTSKNIGKLKAGSYRVNMKPYNSAGGGADSNIVDFTVENSAVQPGVSSTFTERYNAPSASDIHYYSSQNTFVAPNCTWYAFGRAWEIRGTQIPHYGGNAKDWWTLTALHRSKTKPALGAIAVWGGANNSLNQGNGHVAIVEEISHNGKIVTVSEGNYLGSSFHRETVKEITHRKDCGKFLGYIYIR